MHVNDVDCGSSSWTFTPSGSSGVFELRLADPQHGAPAGLLTAHKSVPRDNRGSDSAYVHVNVGKHPGALWRITPV